MDGAVSRAGVVKIKEIRMALFKVKVQLLMEKFIRNMKNSINPNPLLWDQIFLVNDLSFQETAAHNVKKKKQLKLEREDSLYMKKNNFIAQWAESVKGTNSFQSNKKNSNQKQISNQSSKKTQRVYKISSNRKSSKKTSSGRTVFILHHFICFIKSISFQARA